MGFLKNMMNSMTGNWAEVNLQFGDGRRGEPIPMKVYIQNKENAIQIDNVYIKIQAVEEVEANTSETCDKCNNDVSFNFSETNTVYENKILLLTSPTTLQPQERVELDASVTIPENLFSTYNGKNVCLKYDIIAGIEMKGNDPDSGWTEIRIA